MSNNRKGAKTPARETDAPLITAPTEVPVQACCCKWTQDIGPGQLVRIGEMEMQVVMKNAGPSPVRVLTNFVNKTLTPGQLHVQPIVTELSLETAEGECCTVEMQFIPWFRRRH